MGSAERIRDLLPSLWRPEPGGHDLLARLVAAGGAQLDRARIDAGDTMQAHWLRFADSALLSPWVAATRRAQRRPPLVPGDPEEWAHSWLDDLPRLAGLLGLRPHDEPADGRETVEAFRARVVETVRLWKEDIATRSAIVEAARLALSGMAERGVAVEEFAPGPAHVQAARTQGPVDGVVGPLMRWLVVDPGLFDCAPEVFVESVTPQPGQVDATVRPLIERFDPATGAGVGLAYDGALAPGQVLSLRPGFSSWLGGPSGLARAISRPGAVPADPTAAGGWVAAEGAPALPVGALAMAADGALWAAFDAGGSGVLWRLDADGWAEVAADLPQIHCLLTRDADLLVGHGGGLSRVALFAPVALLPDPAAGDGPAVHAMARDPGGGLWAATAAGAARIGPDDTLIPVGPGARAETRTALAVVQADPDGILHFGGAAGVFRHDPATGDWHVYAGASLEDAVPDWVRWDPEANPLPRDDQVFLPAVTAILRGPDASLWLGTGAGLARYGARRLRGTYATRLQAFPHLGTDPVHALTIDERQRLWAGTDRGLLVFDGRDWFQAQDGLARLPHLPAESPATGWRFDRGAGRWQAATAGDAGGFVAASPDVISATRDPVRSILWTDHAEARLGAWADGAFVEDAAAEVAALRQRIKPDATRIVDGGIPALPRITPGRTHWRYLAIEDPTTPPPRTLPAWTCEGRLLPPPDEAPPPEEGRFLAALQMADLDRVYAFNPAARVQMRWQSRAPLSITVRIERRDPDETLPPPVLDRVFAAINLVRPAGARIRLVHGETVVRGDRDG